MARSNEILTPPGILSFHDLFAPRAIEPGQEAKFSATLIFNKEAQKHPNFRTMQEAVAEVGKAAFGQNVDFSRLRMPFRDAGEKLKYAGYEEGFVFVTFRSKNRVGIVGPDTTPILSADEVWSGQEVWLKATAFSYDVSGNKGISFGLGNVQVRDNTLPRLDGRTSAEHDFEPLVPKSGNGSAEKDPLPF